MLDPNYPWRNTPEYQALKTEAILLFDHILVAETTLAPDYPGGFTKRQQQIDVWEKHLNMTNRELHRLDHIGFRKLRKR